MNNLDDLWRGERKYRVMRFGINEEYFKKKPDEEKKLRNVFIVAAVAVVVVGIVFVTMMVVAIKQTSEATKYDLNCLAEPTNKPLTECRTE